MTRLDNWDSRFPNCQPVAHWLRVAFPELWVRFHSLPESKRYPEDESEYATVLHRHNCILEELTGSERSVVLLATEYSESPNPAQLQTELQILVPHALPWRSVAMHESDDDFASPSFWHVFTSVWEWHPGAFDPIVRLVIDDCVANLMILNADCRWLLHPYDGGMDVIAESSAARDRLKSSHPGWLSANPSGL
jgi:hypothetical protein